MKNVLITSINVLVIALPGIFFSSCNQKKEIRILSAEQIIHGQQDQLTQVIIYDVFTPPVASRIYAYTSLAAYEAMRFAKPGESSLAEKMNGFGKMPVPDPGKKYDFVFAASRAFFAVAHKVVFSLDSLKTFENTIDQQFKSLLSAEVYQNSIAFGDMVGKAILKRAGADNYFTSRSKPKYLGSNEPGKWRPTPPDYLDGVEFCWNEMKPLLLDSAAQFLPAPPPPYSTDSSSAFYNEVMKVYEASQKLSPEQITIAKFWDDNPFVMEHSGHLMMGKKKITPGGHWMGIAAIASQMTHADPVKAAKTYALTATALFDAFISCWDSKYKWNYIRPVTFINEFIDKTWTPLLQTPPFPEYTSGHSTITAAAAAILTKLYGDGFAFRDTSDLRYIGMERHFDSFQKAAEETSISRFYGGIHYMNSVEKGTEVGKSIAALMIAKLGL